MAMRILLVEDDVESLQMMADVLGTFDVEVVPLSDSEEACTRVNREKFDGIFLDLLMPKLDGYRLAKAIRESGWNRTTPIVIVTGSRDHKVMEQAFHAGGNFFLSKPVDRRRLAILMNTTRGVMLANRRSLLRVALHVDVAREDVPASPRLWSRDISERGMLLAGDTALQVGQDIRLSFCLPAQSERVSTHVVVTRAEGNAKIGVSFRSLKQTDRQRIRIYVAEECARKEPAAEHGAEIMP